MAHLPGDRPEQTAIAIFHHHPLLQLVRIGTNSETAFTVAAEGSKPRNVQRRKLVAGGEQGMNIRRWISGQSTIRFET